MKKNLLGCLMFLVFQTLNAQSITLDPIGPDEIKVNSKNANQQVIANFVGIGASHTSLYIENNSAGNARVGIGFLKNSLLRSYIGIDSQNLTFGRSNLTFGDMKISSTGDVGIGLNFQSPSAMLHVNGFTKLGFDAPAIKVKKLSSGCTTSANSGFPNGEE
ncbi:MAG: hypothetical protein U5M51_08375 [Emticicia sp.]|nr:hypothetical protein [Emticicia sp.]